MIKRLFVLFSTLLVIYAFIVEPGFLHHNKYYKLDIPNWPTKLSGFRILVLADLHVGAPFNKINKLTKIVEITNRRKPDLILLAGDFVTHGVLGGSFVEPKKISEELKKLKAKYGVFAVLGNHDYWHDAAEVSSALKNSGISVLINESLKIKTAKGAFWLAGIDDFWVGNPDIEKTLLPISDSDPIIAFTHNPDLFVKIPNRVSLTIAGHTHGGQVYLPFVGRPVVPSKYGERFAIGHIIEDTRHLFVNPGLGTSILPVRFLVPPEISELELH